MELITYNISILIIYFRHCCISLFFFYRQKGIELYIKTITDIYLGYFIQMLYVTDQIIYVYNKGQISFSMRV